MSKVAVIILNWNRAVDTIECLQSIIPTVTEGLSNLVVVDNASSDDSAAIIARWMTETASEHGLEFSEFAGAEELPDCDSELVLMRSSHNGGYAAGNNIGIKYTLNRGDADLVWVLNNDTVVAPSAVGELIRFAENNQHLAIIGSTVIDYYSHDKIESAGGYRHNPWILVSRPVLGGVNLESLKDKDTALDMDYVSGAAMLIRSSAIRKIGLLNEDYLLYYEELDYAARARRLGYRLGWCSGSLVYHKGGASIGSRSRMNASKSVLSEYHSNLSALKYTRLFHPKLLYIASLNRFMLKLVLLLVMRDTRLFAPLAKAYKDFYLRKDGD